jgi:CBF1 interacting corepressor
MPGLSFLFKKRFHPSRTDNQKRLFVAEQQTAEKNDREVELAKEVAKERDIQHFENMGSMEFRDPRTAALKFMYAAPQSKDAETPKKDNKRMASIKDYEAKIDERTGEDEMVRAFKAKIAQTKLKRLGEAAAQDQLQPHDVYPPEDASYEEANSARSRVPQHLSALEKEVGRRRSEVTHEQMVERFAVLKNAPMEGGYAKGMVVKHKPFSEQLRNVHCIRCGQWGHMSGERECPLRDYNPNDYERQQREDPMRRMLDGPSAGAGSAYMGPGRSSSSASGGTGISRQRCTFVDEAGDSDPEAEFLSTLTRREKKLLLRKLQVSYYYRDSCSRCGYIIAFAYCATHTSRA